MGPRSGTMFPRSGNCGEDEAFVLVGQTPPETRYFSFGRRAMLVPGDPWTPNP